MYFGLVWFGDDIGFWKGSNRCMLDSRHNSSPFSSLTFKILDLRKPTGEICE